LEHERIESIPIKQYCGFGQLTHEEKNLSRLSRTFGLGNNWYSFWTPQAMILCKRSLLDEDFSPLIVWPDRSIEVTVKVKYAAYHLFIPKYTVFMRRRSLDNTLVPLQFQYSNQIRAIYRILNLKVVGNAFWKHYEVVAVCNIYSRLLFSKSISILNKKKKNITS